MNLLSIYRTLSDSYRWLELLLFFLFCRSLAATNEKWNVLENFTVELESHLDSYRFLVCWCSLSNVCDFKSYLYSIGQIGLLKAFFSYSVDATNTVIVHEHHWKTFPISVKYRKFYEQFANTTLFCKDNRLIECDRSALKGRQGV